MPKYCIVGQCTNSSNSESMHLMPKDPATKRKWDAFVRTTRVWSCTYSTVTSVVCGKHFRPSDFENWTKVQLGFAKRALLRTNAVPSIRYPASQAQGQSNMRGPGQTAAAGPATPQAQGQAQTQTTATGTVTAGSGTQSDSKAKGKGHAGGECSLC